MKRLEESTAGDSYREEYLRSVTDLLHKKQEESVRERDAFFADFGKDPEAYRQKFREMLGWPLTSPRPESVNVRVTPVELGWDVDIFRMEFEVFESFTFYGILFRQKKEPMKKRPFVLSQHGGLGTPELCSGLFGSTANYNNMTERILAMDGNVFAPQLLLWPILDENGNKTEFRREYDLALRQVGGSVTALELYCLSTVLDYFEKQPYVDRDNISMVGLSYGGFYAMFAAAADTRIRRALSCSQFNDRILYNWSDWSWQNGGNTFGDAEVALLVAPRRLTICVGTKDDLFDVRPAEREYNRLREKLAALGGAYVDSVEFIPFDGTHELIRDDGVLRRTVLGE